MNGGNKDDGLEYKRPRRLKCDRRNFRQPHPKKNNKEEKKKRTTSLTLHTTGSALIKKMRGERNRGDFARKSF
jgi:hypothetical protein